MKKNPRIYLEKNPENDKKKPRHTKCLKKSKPNLKSTLPGSPVKGSVPYSGGLMT